MNDTPSIVNGDADINGFPPDRLPRHQPEVIYIDDEKFGPGVAVDE
jgi:hypothetical protein